MLNYGLNYGLDSLIGTEFYHNSGIIPTKLAYEIISYPMKYSESLFLIALILEIKASVLISS